ncbi:MAG: NAD(P)-dependent oxidoreductase [Tissierellales bacterium]
MKVLLIGARTLLGTQTAHELLKRGHTITAIPAPYIKESRPDLEDIQFLALDCMFLNIDELMTLMTGCDALIFTAGLDENIKTKDSISELYYKYNIAPLEKLLPLAKKTGIKQTVICSSFFAYMDRTYPEWDLASNHPYIKNRVDQAKVALSYADQDFAVSILEFPYILGSTHKDLPICKFLKDSVKKNPFFTFYPKGGTSAISIDQAGQCIVSAMEIGKGGQIFPLSTYNISWKDLINSMHKELDTHHKKAIPLNSYLLKRYLKRIFRQEKTQGFQTGLEFSKLKPLIVENVYINDFNAKSIFRVRPENLSDLIKISLSTCLYED